MLRQRNSGRYARPNPQTNHLVAERFHLPGANPEVPESGSLPVQFPQAAVVAFPRAAVVAGKVVGSHLEAAAVAGRVAGSHLEAAAVAGTDPADIAPAGTVLVGTALGDTALVGTGSAQFAAVVADRPFRNQPQARPCKARRT